VAGIILASAGPVEFLPIADDALAEAERLVGLGRGSGLLAWGSYGEIALSARTLLEWAPGKREALDVCGVEASDPPIRHIRCPLLAFYGTKGDIGAADELERIRRNATGAARVDTRLFEGADHAYAGREQQVAAGIAAWLDLTCGR
jgi:hypothetical protein